MNIDSICQEKYPLCYAAGVDGNEFEETRLSNEIVKLCNKRVPKRLEVRQIEILKKLNNNEKLTSIDVHDCQLIQDLPGEEWKDIPKWNGKYAVSSYGRLRVNGFIHYGCRCRVTEHLPTIKISTITPDDTLNISLDRGVFHQAYIIADLVLDTFCPITEDEIRECKTDIEFIDNDSMNVRLSNMQRINKCGRKFIDEESVMTSKYLDDYPIKRYDLIEKYDEFIRNRYPLSIALGRTEVNHRDGNKLNNRADNLEWINRHENITHARQHDKLHHIDSLLNKNSKLSKEQVIYIRQARKRGVTCEDLSHELGVAATTISEAATGVKYADVNDIEAPVPRNVYKFTKTTLDKIYDDMENVIERLRNGETPEQISKNYGCVGRTVSQAINKYIRDNKINSIYEGEHNEYFTQV